MKKNNNLYIILLVIPLLLLSCSSGEKQGSGNDSALSIKGFTLGMDLDAAVENAVHLFREAGIAVKPTEEKKIDFNNSYQLMILKESGDISYMDLAADSERRLTRFSFHPNTLDLLFGFEGLDNDAIAEKLMAEFDLPDLTQDDSGYWEYREVEGIQIQLNIKVSNRYFTVEGFVFD